MDIESGAVTQVTIRPVEACDIEAVRHVLVATWHATYDGTLGAAKVDEIAVNWHSAEALMRQVETPEALFLLAEHDNGVVGCGFARLDRQGKLDLGQLYVLPGAQRQGVGRRLLTRLIGGFPQATSVRLEVESRNVRAIAFYEGAGFKVVGMGEDCRGCGSLIAHVVMEKPL
jgi:ribosomal protein S18 acetylase RimI-like enzyme